VVSVFATYKADADSVLRGGVKDGARFEDNLDITFDADLSRAIRWAGATARVHILNNAGDTHRQIKTLISAGSTQVDTAVNEMDQATEQNAALFKQSAAATHSLEGEVAELMGLMGAFSIGAAAPEDVAPPTRRVVERGRPSVTRGARVLARKPDVSAENWEEN
jgi:hypothetical protein